MVLESVKSVFYVNNEMVNFWSYFLLIVIFIVWYCLVIWVYSFLVDYFYFFLMFFIFGCCIVYIMSCVVYLFSFMIEWEFYIGYYFDYVVISVYMFIVGEVFYFYCYFIVLGFLLYDWCEFFLVLFVLLLFCVIYLCCMFCYWWFNLCFIICIGFYIMFWLYNCLLYFVC